jgi:hypothetical protein
MKAALHIEIENHDSANHILALARLLDFPGDEGVYTDNRFWYEDAYPAIHRLFHLIYHYVDSRSDAAYMLNSYDDSKRCLAMCDEVQAAITLIRKVIADDEYAFAQAQAKREDIAPPDKPTSPPTG